MARKQKTADKKGEDALVKTLRSLFKKEYPELVPFARGGVRLLNYLFDATKAADKVPVPKGFTMNPVEVSNSTPKGKQEMVVVGVISELLEAALGIKQEESNLPESNVHFSYAVVPARRPAALENAAPPRLTVLFDQLKAVIVESLGIDPTEVDLDATFIEDLGCDSLDLVETVMAIEDAFAIEIVDEDAEKMITVGDVYDYLKKLPGVKTFPDKNYQCTGIV